MCLILLAHRIRPETPLIVAANRDEFYSRPAQPAHFWPDAPGLLAGRDQTAGGTWLGINRRGGFAAITNFAVAGMTDTAGETLKSPSIAVPGSASMRARRHALRSRGELTSGFLRGTATAAEYARSIRGFDYQGFNLLLWDGQNLVYTCNCGITGTLAPGYYGLTNAELGVRWPKVTDGIERLGKIAEAGATADALIDALRDDRIPPDHRLPHRGRPLDWERRLAACFIRGKDYGTRASTAVIWQGGEISLTEQGYASGGRPAHRVGFRVELADGSEPPGRGPPPQADLPYTAESPWRSAS